MSHKRQKIALLGNPNSGKSSLFNQLTGLNQKIGNFPGVTVDKRSGHCALPDGTSAEVIDLPGIYSIYPRSLDEQIVAEVLLDHHSETTPDKIVVTADATNLKRGLLLLTQITDIGLPTILALNMMDLVAKAGINYDLKKLSQRLGVPVVPINARNGIGLDELKKVLSQPLSAPQKSVFNIWDDAKAPVKELREKTGVDNDYEAYQFLEQPKSLKFLSKEKQLVVDQIRSSYNFFPGKFQGAETIQRYSVIQDLLNEVILKTADHSWKNYSGKLDRIMTHKVWGYLIFFAILFLIFQAIFAWATVPMDFIDAQFANLSSYLSSILPDGPLTSLLSDGIVPGIGGILIFIPQIAILFAFISVLEESGYMARVVFLMDKIMRKFGLNGKSVVPLMSGVACAIPAIMATRTIDNWKERTITIFVTPLMSCSARLPVFTILIALIVPNQRALGFFNLQGLALMGLYLLGFVAAIGSAWVMKFLIRVKERSYLIMELPTYRVPKWSNVGYTIIEKTKAFVLEAGKVIMAISIVLWVLASYGPGDKLANARENVLNESQNLRLTEQGLEDRIAAYKLEHSYAGIIGKAIEPAIKPLGYDWKIGIALITSFAAREVFVGTMATIYSIGSVSDEDNATIKTRLKEEINPDTGGPRFTPAVGFSLLIFYTFAMQCMSTLAVVYRETKGWKWPALQLAYMTSLAYVCAFAVYQMLS
ncbi:ferrous iron transport protein B [Fulvivirgaceae bacterium PWU4]|uniref:Ferrous iron transport protein B n=1 Tax=Chryseosolibacter histidini TaxID=2782349 RepID=A0AAP2DLI6_9BACT|nr:ferrous iron transport protein B [Chryseosolibacter histidini]MBT1698583.1 ferrous iron transport protein B [Chryseosolibacter histidini]